MINIIFHMHGLGLYDVDFKNPDEINKIINKFCSDIYQPSKILTVTLWGGADPVGSLPPLDQDLVNAILKRMMEIILCKNELEYLHFDINDTSCNKETIQTLKNLIMQTNSHRINDIQISASASLSLESLQDLISEFYKFKRCTLKFEGLSPVYLDVIKSTITHFNENGWLESNANIGKWASINEKNPSLRDIHINIELNNALTSVISCHFQTQDTSVVNYFDDIAFLPKIILHPSKYSEAISSTKPEAKSALPSTESKAVEKQELAAQLTLQTGSCSSSSSTKIGFLAEDSIGKQLLQAQKQVDGVSKQSTIDELLAAHKKLESVEKLKSLIKRQDSIIEEQQSLMQNQNQMIEDFKALIQHQNQAIEQYNFLMGNKNQAIEAKLEAMQEKLGEIMASRLDQEMHKNIERLLEISQASPSVIDIAKNTITTIRDILGSIPDGLSRLALNGIVNVPHGCMGL